MINSQIYCNARWPLRILFIFFFIHFSKLTCLWLLCFDKVIYLHVDSRYTTKLFASVQGGVAKSDHFCGFIIAIIIISLIVVIYRLPKLIHFFIYSIFKSIFWLPGETSQYFTSLLYFFIFYLNHTCKHANSLSVWICLCALTRLCQKVRLAEVINDTRLH